MSGWVVPPGGEQPKPGQMFTRTYKARSQAAAARKMQADGDWPGYELSGQSWGSGGRSCAAQGFVVVGVVCLVAGLLFPPLWVLAVISLVIGLVSGREGELTVTWTPVRIEAPAPQSVAPAPDHAAGLASLKSMLDAGHISAEEYEAKKAEILGRM